MGASFGDMIPMEDRIVKRRIVLYLLPLVLITFGMVLTASAETDKEIRFADHSFGEAFGGIRPGINVESILFGSQFPRVSREIVDPAYDMAAYAIYEPGDSLCFTVDAGMNGNRVADYEVNTRYFFHYPSPEAALSFDLNSGVLYAGAYDFFDEDENKVDAIYTDLKRKLISVYGEPDLETDNADDIWGEIHYREDEGASAYAESLEQTSPVSYTVWKSSANNASIYLVNWNDFGYRRTSIYYVADEDQRILEMYGSPIPSDDGNDDVSGL